VIAEAEEYLIQEWATKSQRFPIEKEVITQKHETYIFGYNWLFDGYRRFTVTPGVSVWT